MEPHFLIFVKEQEVIYIRGANSAGPVQRMKNCDDQLGFYVKSYLQISKGAIVGPLVFVFADPSLEDTALTVIEVLGLTLNHGASRAGFICFTSTRGGNTAFYDWLIQTPIKAFVEELKAQEDKCYHVLYSTDGEDIQLDGFARNNAVLKSLDVIYLKGSASCSALSNALDAGNIHKGSKKISKCAPWSEILRGRATLQLRIDTLLASHCSHLALQRRNLITDSSIRIQHALTRITTKDIIDSSFDKAGQRGPDFLTDKMRNCTAIIPTVESDRLREKFPVFVEYARATKGAGIPVRLMDKHEIIKSANVSDRRTLDKDLRPVSNMRACIANSEDMIIAKLDAPKLPAQRLLDEQERKAKEKVDNAAEKAARKVAKADAKAEAKAAAKVVREAAKVEREAKRAEEKEAAKVEREAKRKATAEVKGSRRKRKVEEEDDMVRIALF